MDLQSNGSALDMTGLAVTASGDASARLATKEFSTKRFVFSASGMKGKDKFEVKLDAPSLKLTDEDKFTAANLPLNAKLDGAGGNIIAALAVPGIEGTASSFKVDAMTLNAELKQPEQDFKLKLTSPVTGSIDAQQFNLSGSHWHSMPQATNCRARASAAN